MEKLLNRLLFEALKVKATDVHFILTDYRIRCQLRGIKGFVNFEDNQLPSLFQYLKYKSNLDLGNLNTPQSGTFTYSFKEHTYFFRFSCITTFQNQSGVLRILNKQLPATIDTLSKKKSQIIQFKKWCHLRSGLIIMSGPTGSGKSTTLHILLEEIARKKQLKIMTLEDPIEIFSDSFLQLQINEKINFTYDEGIRQLLRHDPDILMIGEIRDEKCAHMAYRAALTGHLVFTTLHAKSATEAIKRLEDLGISKNSMKETLCAVVNQRLYPDMKRKERVCVYEILANEALKTYLEEGHLTFHKTIFDEIREAVKKKHIHQSDAKIDLYDS